MSEPDYVNGAEWEVFFDGDDRYSWERFTQREPAPEQVEE